MPSWSPQEVAGHVGSKLADCVSGSMLITKMDDLSKMFHIVLRQEMV